MEPNKFEKHIKKQMQDREIRPSADAWERISTQLETSDGRKNKKFLWYAVAASFTGLLVISILFFQSTDNGLDGDVEIVDTNKEEFNNARNDLQPEKENEIQKPLNIDETDILAKEEHSNQEANPDKKEGGRQSLKTLNDQTAIVAATQEVNNEEVKIKDLFRNSEERIDLKVAEVLAQVDLLEQNKESLTDAEVDSLLYEAQRQLLTEKIFDKNASVDAIALLNQVEGELDQSFRDQIFEKLKSGFLKVRTAVADRNN